jgi:hypothetical protein
MPAVLSLLGIFLNESFRILLKCYVVFLVMMSMSNLFPCRDILRLGNNQSHKKPCQGGRMVAEPQECQNFLKKKKPEPIGLPPRVHCRDAQPARKIPISLASCEKRRFSVASEPQHSNDDSLFDPGGRNQSEHFLSRQKQSA